MPYISAIQVISPAIERTKRYLFQPFQLGRFLKLTLVAALTEGGISSFNFNSNFPSGNTGGSETPFHLPSTHWPALPVIVGIVAVVLLIVIPICILISYLLIRLRFSFFDCVLHRQDQICPAWSRCHRQAMRYLGLTIWVGLAFWILMIPVGYALYVHFKPLLESLAAQSAPAFPDILRVILPMVAILIPLVLLLALIGYIVETAMGCFILPRMAIEDASILESLEDAWSDIRSEPGPFALFFLFRALLSIAASILAFIVLLVPIIALALIGVVFVLILKAISGGLAVALGIPAAILAVALLVVAGIALGGTIGTFQRNYAILFYAGRYPDMAMILWPQPPPSPFPTPFPSTDSGMMPGPVEGA